MQKYSITLGLGLLLVACQTSNNNDRLIDTTYEAIVINQLMDDWHHAAALADEAVFFGSMRENGIYLGTDKSERWEKQQFMDWSKEIFQRDTAWAFTPYDRELYFAENGHTAWFEELLDTWMGPCRGSGVLTLQNNEWKIAHYNLAMLIDNDDVQDVLKIINEPLKDTTQQPLSPQDSQ